MIERPTSVVGLFFIGDPLSGLQQLNRLSNTALSKASTGRPTRSGVAVLRRSRERHQRADRLNQPPSAPVRIEAIVLLSVKYWPGLRPGRRSAAPRVNFRRLRSVALAYGVSKSPT